MRQKTSKFCSAIFSALILLFAQSDCFGQAALTEERVSGKKIILSQVEKVKEICLRKRDVIIEIEEIKVLCYHGEILTSPKVDYNRKYSFIYINSPGGDVYHAITLGREIFRNGAYAIIDQHCHSACGTYLIPSPKRIYMTENTVLSMHTATPRTASDFLNTRYPSQLRSAISNASKGGRAGENLISLFSKYDEFYKDFVIREMDFFKSIVIDVAFAQRYREIFRTLSKRKDYKCKPVAGLHLIIGPEYLEEFNVKTIHSWFPENKASYVELLPKTSKSDALIYDFDDHPFWTPELGLVTPEDCLRAEE